MQIFPDLLVGELKLYVLLVTPVALYLIYNARAHGQSRASGTNTSTDARKRFCVLCNEVRLLEVLQEARYYPSLSC